MQFSLTGEAKLSIGVKESMNVSALWKNDYLESAPAATRPFKGQTGKGNG